MDIVKQIELICDDLSYKFHYGNKSHLNLIDQNGQLEPNKIHLLLFPPTRQKKVFDDDSRVYNGNFAFVLPDEFAQDYYNNTNSSETQNKYDTKIMPLIDLLEAFETRLEYCDEMDVQQFNSIDLVDYLDANLTGLWVTYQVKVYE